MQPYYNTIITRGWRKVKGKICTLQIDIGGMYIISSNKQQKFLRVRFFLLRPERSLAGEKPMDERIF